MHFHFLEGQWEGRKKTVQQQKHLREERGASELLHRGNSSELWVLNRAEVPWTGTVRATVYTPWQRINELHTDLR